MLRRIFLPTFPLPGSGVFLLAFFVLGALPLRGEIDEDEAVARVKKLPVSALDPALPKEPFSQWLARISGPQAKTFWEVNDCGEQTGDPAVDAGRDFPACVESTTHLPDGRSVSAQITVGTWELGFVGEPAVRDIYWAEGQQVHNVARLRDLPKVIAAEPPDPPLDPEDEKDGPAPKN